MDFQARDLWLFCQDIFDSKNQGSILTSSIDSYDSSQKAAVSVKGFWTGITL